MRQRQFRKTTVHHHVETLLLIVHPILLKTGSYVAIVTPEEYEMADSLLKHSALCIVPNTATNPKSINPRSLTR